MKNGERLKMKKNDLTDIVRPNPVYIDVKNENQILSPVIPFAETAMHKHIYIDAGIEHIHAHSYQSTDGRLHFLTNDIVIKNNDELSTILKTPQFEQLINPDGASPEIFITGKLADITRDRVGGKSFTPSAVLWAAAKHHMKNTDAEALSIIDLSASGYMVICIDKNGELKDDLLIVNPRCGAGTGINLNRILEKLDIGKEAVDRILNVYLDAAGEKKRQEIPTRSDRCGVFSSSATISDKNQGIPIEYALAVTLKSEVIKPCAKIPRDTHTVFLTGGVFRWQYARDCASDILKQKGVKEIVYDQFQSMNLVGMKALVESIGIEHLRGHYDQPGKDKKLFELPAFYAIQRQYEKSGLYKRLPETEFPTRPTPDIINKNVNVGLDIGSTVAKIVVSDADGHDILYFDSYDNHGDTIQTIQFIFSQFKKYGVDKLKIQNIGITGSGRYQVQKTLQAVYPHLAERISVLVENYAHARGSINFARRYIDELENNGVEDINKSFYVLVDIGGEDTKVSVISLKKGELFDNAMNVKCSAGTGSLMDTLKAMFSIENIGDAYQLAQNAPRAYGINATCAVFLMENARRMQADGYRKDEILASCCYAIVENMARSLWDQVEFPENTLILLHGQTMRSDPLPLAVTKRAQDYLRQKIHCLVPPLPGHRACIGLIDSMKDEKSDVSDYCRLDDLIKRQFDKRITVCRGVACGDGNARCARTRLVSNDESGKIILTLGGCTAVNEMLANHVEKKSQVPDAYQNIWDFFDEHNPRSEAPNRLVIPRSFAVSDKALFFARIFQKFGVPVHVDNVQESDVLEGQPYFKIDTCAPNIGATGQAIRLANEPHGLILVPQIDFLPTGDTSLGRTCTTNQGGVMIAKHFGERANPNAVFKYFVLSLDKIDAHYIASQLYADFSSILRDYAIEVSPDEFLTAIKNALDEEQKIRTQAQELVADFIEQAIHQHLNISIVCGREYILNPGIYDSHAGKLLHDKNVVAIPSYAIDTTLDHQFNYMYWKNPHDIMTKVTAISQKKMHSIVTNERLQYLFKKIELGQTQSFLSTVIVSTFRCGPDSMSLPALTEITKNSPTLLIQSDAMIAELAHLENRVNTHLNQLEKNLHGDMTSEKKDFSIAVLEEFNLDVLRKDKDVLYFPTIGDNRTVTAVFRAAGMTTIDNFDDRTFDLEEKTKVGRRHLGDAVCAPLAAVFSDMLDAMLDFQRRKENDDSLVQGKDRLVLFMVGGDGPCRLGQYVDRIKLQFSKMFGVQVHVSEESSSTFKILNNINSSLLGSHDHNQALEKWSAILAFQSCVLQGVLYAMFLKGSSLCRNADEFEDFSNAFLEFKESVYFHLEHNIAPGRVTKALVNLIEKNLPPLTGVAYYFGFRLYNNAGLRKILRRFSYQWIIARQYRTGDRSKIRIHLDGEVYLRIAQTVQVYEAIVDALGYGEFQLTHTPMWCFLENVQYARILTAENDIATLKTGEQFDAMPEKERTAAIKEKQRNINKSKNSIRQLRGILAGPLYKAAGLPMPHAMEKVFEKAKQILPTFKPYGELVPFIGEALLQLNEGVNLFLNAAPEGCMVSSMGEILSPHVLLQSPPNTRMQHLFSTEGEVDDELLKLSLLKVLGPEQFYKV